MDNEKEFDGTDEIREAFRDGHRLGAEGARLADQGNHAAALDLYEQALLLAPTDAIVWANKGRSKEFLREYDEAIECYDRAAVLDPDLMVGPEKGRVFLHLRRFEEAIALFDQGIKADPDMPCFWQNKGTALLALDRTAEALACYERVLTLQPDHFGALRMKAQAQEKLGLPVDLGEANLTASIKQARVAREAGRFEDAFQILMRLSQEHPTSDVVWLNLGNVLQDVGMFDEAIVSYERALGINPQVANTWSNRGNALARRWLTTAEGEASNLPDETRLAILQCHDRALEIDPKSGQAWMNKGGFLVVVGQLQEAVDCFIKAEQLGHPQAKSGQQTVLSRLSRG